MIEKLLQIPKSSINEQITKKHYHIHGLIYKAPYSAPPYIATNVELSSYYGTIALMYKYYINRTTNKAIKIISNSTGLAKPISLKNNGNE
jgi:hypothetical protein